MGMSSIYGGSTAATFATGVDFNPGSSDGDQARETGRSNEFATGTRYSPSLTKGVSANSIIADMIELQSKTTADTTRNAMQAGATNAATQMLTQVQNAVNQFKAAGQIYNEAIAAAGKQEDATVDQAVQDLVSGIMQGAAAIGMAAVSYRCNKDIAALSRSDDDMVEEKDDAAVGKNSGVKIKTKTEAQVEKEEDDRKKAADRIWQKAQRHIDLTNAFSSMAVDMTKSGTEFAVAAAQNTASTDEALKEFLTNLMNTMAQECQNTIQQLLKISDSLQTLASGAQNMQQQTTSQAIDVLH